MIAPYTSKGYAFFHVTICSTYSEHKKAKKYSIVVGHCQIFRTYIQSKVDTIVDFGHVSIEGLFEACLLYITWIQ